MTVCRRFLQEHEAYRECLYEVEAPGSWNQRRNIWLNIQLGRYALCKNVQLETTSPNASSRSRRISDFIEIDECHSFFFFFLGVNEKNSLTSGDHRKKRRKMLISESENLFLFC